MASSDTGNWIGELDPSLPAGSERLSDGDDAIRQFKKATQDTWPNLFGAVSWTDVNLNQLDTHIGVDNSQIVFDITNGASPTLTLTQPQASFNSKPVVNVADPTAGNMLGDRDYNDNRYELETDAQAAYALIAFAIEIARQEGHPIYSVYLTIDNVNPGSNRSGGSSALGFGTWVKDAEGRFLVGTGSNTDSTGLNRNYGVGNDGWGTYRHRLTEGQMPSHDHRTLCDHKHWVGAPQSPQNVGEDKNADHGIWLTSDKAGGNQYHENSPPGFGVYLWWRTA